MTGAAPGIAHRSVTAGTWGVSSGSPTLTRITVTTGSRRADLAVPSGVPFAELVPGLAQSLGVLDGHPAYEACRAATTDGRTIRTDVGLAAQGIEDGDVVVIMAPADDEPPIRYDDVAEAMARVVEDVPAWDAHLGRWASWGSAGVLLAVGALALAGEHDAAVAAWFAGVTACVLIAAAAVLSRGSGEIVVAVGAAHAACAYAVVAALGVGGHACSSACAVAKGVGGSEVAGLLAVLALTRGRRSMLPAVLAGCVVLITDLLAWRTRADPAELLTGLLTLVVIAGGALPNAALGATGAGRHASVLSDDVARDVSSGVDMARLAADARRAREVLVTLSATAGTLLVVLAPFAASLGPIGAAVPVLGCVVVMLRTRRCRARADVVLGVVPGVMGIAVTLMSLPWLGAPWRLTAGMTAVAAGVAVMAAAMVPRPDAARRGRLGDLAECIALGSLLPAALLAIGLSVSAA